ncbi:hypothetical protein BH11PSE11_BH11PSE11_08070 [soil metagenome]
MAAESLKESLKKLHANLDSAGELDPELKEMLEMLDADIQTLLMKDEQTSSEAGDLADQAQAISAKFAAEHPRIEPVLRELGNILASMGI